MPRPPIADRALVASENLVIRLTPSDRSALDGLVERAELARLKTGGEGERVTATGLVRGWIQRETSGAPAPSRERYALPAEGEVTHAALVGAVEAAINSHNAKAHTGGGQSELAKVSGVDVRRVADFRHGRRDLASDSKAALVEALRRWPL